MTISRTPSSRLTPAAAPTDNGGAAQGASSSAGQSSLPSAPAGLHSRQPSSFSFDVQGASSSMPPRAAVLEIVELPSAGATPEHDGRNLLRSGERSDSNVGARSGAGAAEGGRRNRLHDFLDISSRRLASLVLGSGSEPGSARASSSGTPSGRALTGAPTFAVRVPPPERSWRSVANAIVQGAGQAGAVALREVALAAQSVLPSKSAVASVAQNLAPAAGHLIHQAVAVGLPTFARDMMAAGVMHGLRDQPPSVAMGLQATMGAVNLGLQIVREVRERRHPDEAARAYHSLTPEQWASKTPAEQAAMRAHTQKVSRAITVSQVASSIANFSMMAAFIHQGPEHRAAALQPLATEMKVGLYTTLRDAAQASFTMVAHDDERASAAAGLRGNAFAAAAATYAGAMTAGAFASSAAMAALVPGRSDATAVLLGASHAMSGGDAWRVTAAAAGVNAVTNTLVEATDWFQRTHFDLSQNPAPPPQILKPAIDGTDYGRLGDQAQTRTALINSINSALAVAGVAMEKAGVSPALQGTLSNIGLGAMVALSDSPITGNWQAQSAVREAVAESARPPAAPATGLPVVAAETAGHTEGAQEGGGRLTGRVSARDTPRPSFRGVSVPGRPTPLSSGTTTPRNGNSSDEEQRSGELPRPTRQPPAGPGAGNTGETMV